MGFLGGTLVRNLLANAGDSGEAGWTPRSGKSPGVGHGKLLQYSCLENSTNRGTCWAKVHGVTKSRTRLITTNKCQCRVTQQLFFLLIMLVHYSIILVFSLLYSYLTERPYVYLLLFDHKIIPPKHRQLQQFCHYFSPGISLGYQFLAFLVAFPQCFLNLNQHGES